jgi:hypothetical protein
MSAPVKAVCFDVDFTLIYPIRDLSELPPLLV